MATTKGDIRTFNRRLDEFVGEIRKMANDTFVSILNMSVDDLEEATPLGDPSLWHPPVWPKGYIPGTARAGWTILVNGLPARSVSMVTAKDRVKIVNAVPYMEALNRGHSSQAQPGWVERVFDTIKLKIQTTQFAPPGFKYARIR